MTPPRPRRLRRLLSLLALPAAIATSGSVDAAAPPTVPEGYVRLVDDTGAITVVVPDSWTDVDTAPTPSGTDLLPYISATPDAELYLESFDVPGVVYSAVSHVDDVDSFIAEFGPTTGCADFAVAPYDDGVFVGLAQTGTSCGTAGQSTWFMVVASPADESMTAIVQIQMASNADFEAASTVFETFDLTGQALPTTSTLPAAPGPGVSVPAGLGPVEVATTFLDALAAGDGATACALLTAEEMTINFVEEAETCAMELSLQVLGQGEFWASVQIAGDENTSSDTCGDEDPGDEYVSLELRGPTDDGCLSISVDNGEWRIEDLSNSIWNQAG